MNAIVNIERILSDIYGEESLTQFLSFGYLSFLYIHFRKHLPSAESIELSAQTVRSDIHPKLWPGE